MHQYHCKSGVVVPIDLPPFSGPVDLNLDFGPDSRMVRLGFVHNFKLGRGEHIRGGVASAGLVDVVDVVGHGHAELFDGAPLSGVEQFG